MKKRIFSIIYMFLITLLFSSMVSAVKLFNEERIQRNEKIKLQRIILEVLDMPVHKGTSDAEVALLKSVNKSDVNVIVYSLDAKFTTDEMLYRLQNRNQALEDPAFKPIFYRSADRISKSVPVKKGCAGYR